MADHDHTHDHALLPLAEEEAGGCGDGCACGQPQTALITGATAGIGHEFARQLASYGWNLVIVARDEKRLAEVAEELHAAYDVSVEVLAADLADPARRAAVAGRLADQAQPVDLLVNNAGFGLKQRFLDNPFAEEQRMHDVLVTAVVELSHAALGTMAERGHGGIINVSSVAAFLPRGTYSAAKAYVNKFSEWAHNEYGPRGVAVMALCPGFVKTEFHERLGIDRDASAPKWMWLEADRLVADAIKDFEKGKAFSIPSKRYKALVTASRVVPGGVKQRLQSLGRK
ncbi:SDR family oxidoreductase [Nocardioides sp.]|uniref:SDR family NAD(P)-dependent oxidoreductase n=1 Tax=Nocardioides sp. TaxID=35761 RepID=UPI002C325431|nr:SDR family oxidoreductase [Nocardioides sp.]HSX67663.1 SDR family oxidoreductase [Nocardioides sp.]